MQSLFWIVQCIIGGMVGYVVYRHEVEHKAALKMKIKLGIPMVIGVVLGFLGVYALGSFVLTAGGLEAWAYWTPKYPKIPRRYSI